MPGKIIRMEGISSTELSGLDPLRTVILLPISPLEGHGPHLPLGVDFFNAVFFAENMARTITERKPEYDVLLFPAIPLGTQVYKLPGSVRVSGRVLYKIVYSFAESVSTWGFKYVFLLSGHGSPKDIVAIETACLRASRRFKLQMYSLSGWLAVKFLRGDFIDGISELLSSPMTAEQRKLLKYDYHGGLWETSMMLMHHPELVKGDYRSLPAVDKSDASAQFVGYYGSPADADIDFARASIEVMSREAYAAVEEILGGRDLHAGLLSPLYKILPLRPGFLPWILAISLSAIALIIAGIAISALL
jgi:creatinine amidohydrolase